MRRPHLFVMVSRLEEVDPVILHQVHQPMLERNAPGPQASDVFQRFRLPESGRSISLRVLHEFEHLHRNGRCLL